MIGTPDDIAQVMKDAFDVPGPVIIGAQVDYSDTHQLFEMVKGDHIH